MASFALYIQHNGLLWLPPRCQEKSCAQFFPWSESDEKWQEVIGQLTPRDQIHLMIDMVEEDSDFVWRPKLYPWEKADFLKMEQRRIDQDQFPLSKLFWTGVTRQQEDGRKEELLAKFLVHPNPHLEAVLSFFEEHHLQVKGIYSITYVIQQLFKRLIRAKVGLSYKQKRQPFFMIVRLSQFRFRQLFFLEEQVHISREILVDEHLENEISIQSAVMIETKAALKYLYNQKILPYNSPVSLLVVDHCEQGRASWRDVVYQDFVLPAWSEAEQWFYKETSFEHIFKRSKVAQEKIEGRFMLAHYAMSQHLPTFYTTPYLKQTQLYLNIAAGLSAFNFFLLAVFVFLLVYEGLTAYSIQQKIQAYQTASVQYEQQKQSLQKLVHLKYDARDLKAVVDFAEDVKTAKGREPAGVDFMPLSQLLAQSPHLQLQSVQWRRAQKLDDPVYQLTLSGWVYPFEGQYGPLVTWVDTFVAQLKQQPHFKNVRLTKAPLNRDVHQVLTVKSQQKKVPALPFEIQFKVVGDGS